MQNRFALLGLFSTATFLLAAPMGAQLKAGDPAPAFEIKESLAPSLTSYQDLRGHVLMLDFFATW